ncbi:hypothetical protein WJX72_000861 [[Myrmecia] bisecta]|uniref:Uncharacterized protein n=1 Tax=[Myrmecia] bisecta TaxID=41462 RepID=A0AAW1PMQ0_9CHLO
MSKRTILLLEPTLDAPLEFPAYIPLPDEDDDLAWDVHSGFELADSDEESGVLQPAIQVPPVSQQVAELQPPVLQPLSDHNTTYHSERVQQQDFKRRKLESISLQNLRHLGSPSTTESHRTDTQLRQQQSPFQIPIQLRTWQRCKLLS